jgi:hypothetical protein
VSDWEGGLDYSRVRRHYDNCDFVSFPFSATADFYPVGARQFMSNPNSFNPMTGWSLHARIPTTPPLFFFPIPYPSPGPQFEAKHVRLRSTRSALVRFSDIRNVEVQVPPNIWFEFWTRTYLVFVRTLPGGTAGTMAITFEG